VGAHPKLGGARDEVVGGGHGRLRGDPARQANREVGHMRFVTSRLLEVGWKPAKSRLVSFLMNITNPLGLKIKTTSIWSSGLDLQLLCFV
jgi:hypothetical protein